MAGGLLMGTTGAGTVAGTEAGTARSVKIEVMFLGALLDATNKYLSSHGYNIVISKCSYASSYISHGIVKQKQSFYYGKIRLFLPQSAQMYKNSSAIWF